VGSLRPFPHTPRVPRRCNGIVQFMGWKWPGDSIELLSTSILDVQAFKIILRPAGYG
jgi:hypothetical protein